MVRAVGRAGVSAHLTGVFAPGTDGFESFATGRSTGAYLFELPPAQMVPAPAFLSRGDQKGKDERSVHQRDFDDRDSNVMEWTSSDAHVVTEGADKPYGT